MGRDRPPDGTPRGGLRVAGARLALAACVLLLTSQAFAAGPLGGSHGSSPLPDLAPLPSPGTGSVPTLGSGSDTGRILDPNLNVPLPTSPVTAPLNNPLGTVPSLGCDLPAGLSPDLKDLSKNVRETIQQARTWQLHRARRARRRYPHPSAERGDAACDRHLDRGRARERHRRALARAQAVAAAGRA